MTQGDEAAARDATLALLADRGGDQTICPSEVARRLASGPEKENWRAFMPVVHAAIDRLVRERAVRLSWKGKPLSDRSGPYRIAKMGAGD